MFEDSDSAPSENTSTPALRAKEKAEEFRMHAELFAIFEGTRKFDAQIIPGLDPNLARDIQRTIGKLEKARTIGDQLIPETSAPDALTLLNFPESHNLSTNDYHVHRRPGELQIIRWLASDEIDLFFQRLQAHFDAALEGHKEDESQENTWKKNTNATAYLKALESVHIDMSARYFREPLRQAQAYALSTQTADELNIAYLCDYIMSVPVEELVGSASAPPDDPTERDLAWFFKLFILRGAPEGIEKACFFAFLQKTDDAFSLD